jgi:hypothetical protein
LELGTDPNNADTDNDGLKENFEVRGHHNTRCNVTFKSNPLRADTDWDGLKDRVEVTGSANKKFRMEPTNPWNKDTDGGGVNDKVEIEAGSNPADSRSSPRNP